jgi:phosphate transport system permease protein
MATTTAPPPTTPDVIRSIARGERLRSRRFQHVLEKFVMAGLTGCALFSVGVTFAIIFVLLGESIRFFQLDDVSAWEFFFTATWNPSLGSHKQFGIWPLITGTMLVTCIAMMVALPLGLVAAIYLSEYAPRRMRSWLKPVLEILAGIPTVVYGFFALNVISPFLGSWIPDIGQLNALSAGIAVGILCIPLVCSLSEDALRAVPRGLRDGALGLGGTKFDVAMKVVVPAALSGIISSFLLAIARATGETMVVAMAAGGKQSPKLTLDPREETLTMTGYMAQAAMGDFSNFGSEYLSMYAVGGTLFVITFSITVVGQIVRKRYREAYK